MFIRTDTTPNLQVLKFSFNFPVNTSGDTFSYIKNQEEDILLPTIVNEIFEIEGVTSIFLGDKFFSIGKNEDSEWINLKARIISVMMDYVKEDEPLFRKAEDGEIKRSDSFTAVKNASIDNFNEEYDPEDPVIKQIIELIDERVRPFVAMDGGDIVFKGFKDGIVYVSLKGACVGCSSSQMTLKNGVENMLKHYVPDVVEVQAIN